MSTQNTWFCGEISKHTTSLQHRCNVTTLQRRCNDVVATLCVCWVSYLELCLKGSFAICRNSRTTGTNPHQSVHFMTSQPVASSQTGNSVEMYRII